MLTWKLRCIAAWMCRTAGVVVSLYWLFVLLRVHDENPSAFQAMFPLGVAEIAVVAFAALVIFDLLGRLVSWANPRGPLPRFRDRRFQNH